MSECEKKLLAPAVEFVFEATRLISMLRADIERYSMWPAEWTGDHAPPRLIIEQRNANALSKSFAAIENLLKHAEQV